MNRQSDFQDTDVEKALLGYLTVRPSAFALSDRLSSALTRSNEKERIYYEKKTSQEDTEKY